MFKKVFAFALMVVFAIIFAIVVIEATPGYAASESDLPIPFCPEGEYWSPVGCMPVDRLDPDYGTLPPLESEAAIEEAWVSLDAWASFMGYGMPTEAYFVPSGESAPTGCEGYSADSNSGFYCQADASIYIGVDLMNAWSEGGLEDLFYVVGHEWGHYYHQSLGLPTVDIGSEIFSDCVAGVFMQWAEMNDIISTSAVPEVSFILGDFGESDGIHGTGRQMQNAFDTGYEAADLSVCESFNINV